MNELLLERALKHFREKILPIALEEDLGENSLDITTLATLKSGARGRARIEAKDELVLAGIPFVDEVFTSKSKEWQIKHLAKEGDEVSRGTVVYEIEGDFALLLTLERTALNTLQRLCGIASKTKTFVKQLEGSRIKILDTRKTIPGFRLLEKYAVKMGGGMNHRMGLYDLFLIKDNHLEAAGGVAPAIKMVREFHQQNKAKYAFPNLNIEVECKTLEQVSEAVTANADIIMLDNMDDGRIRQAIKLIDRKSKIEVSGGVTMGRLAGLARLEIDYISAGAVTHSAPAKDLSMKITRL
jgi:nicotinate-nucleotide pyrophosphorylase (carboxylating)